MLDYRSSPVTAALCGAVALLSLAGMVSTGAHEALALILGNTFGTKLYVANGFTASVYEPCVPKLAVTLWALATGGPVVERAYGTEKFAVYCAATLASAGVCTGAAQFLTFVLTRGEGVLFEARYGGGAVLALVAVGLKHVAPDRRAVPGAPLAASAVPGLLAAYGVAAWAFDVPYCARDAGLALYGVLFSWAWLRFCMPNAGGDGEAGGDLDPDMAFETLLPRPCRPFARPVADFAYGLASLCGAHRHRAARVASRAAAAAAGAKPQSASVNLLAPPVAPPPDPIADRRKQRALKILSDKLNKVTARTMVV